MKRFTLLLGVIALIVAGLAGCGGGADATKENKLEGTPPVNEIQSAPGDTRSGGGERDGG